MIETAIGRGLRRICITDHHDLDHPYEGFRLEADAYVAALQGYREQYRDRIDIRIGVEIGMRAHAAKEMRDFLGGRPFDFVIASLHLIDGRDPYYREEIPLDDAAMYHRGFEETMECILALDGFQSLGHLDYPVRYGYKKEESYDWKESREIIDAILQELIRRDIALEVNSAGYRKLPFPNPHPEILARYLELGGELITIGSDAHRTEFLGYGYDRVEELLREAGVKYYVEFIGKTPEIVAL